jgi:beta-galactosidase beta subunit
MKLREEEISDLVWLGKRIDKSLSFIIKEVPEMEQSFVNFINEYFIPLIEGKYNINEEDYFFEKMDEILDKLEEKFPELLN